MDLFESSNYYYIVTEYLQGRDLFDYLRARNFKLTEERVREIVFQLVLAI